MASKPVMDAAARESRANAREDMAVLTAGARLKVDTAMANMQAVGKKMLSPMDKAKKEKADADAEQQIKEAQQKCDEIKSVATQQAASERAAARGMVAKGVAETGGTRYPVLVTDHPPPSSHTSQKEGGPDSTSDDHASEPLASDKPPAAERNGIHETESASAEPTEIPPSVSPPSRENVSENLEARKEESEEGVEDADYYPSTRVVQT